MVHAAPCFNIVAASQGILLAREHSVHVYSCMHLLLWGETALNE